MDSVVSRKTRQSFSICVQKQQGHETVFDNADCILDCEAPHSAVSSRSVKEWGLTVLPMVKKGMNSEKFLITPTEVVLKPEGFVYLTVRSSKHGIPEIRVPTIVAELSTPLADDFDIFFGGRFANLLERLGIPLPKTVGVRDPSSDSNFSTNDSEEMNMTLDPLWFAEGKDST